MAEKTVPSVQENQTVAAKENTRSTNRYYYPPVDIFEHGNELVVIADVPGADKDQVKIGVKDGVLTVEAATAPQDHNGAIYKEFEWGDFYRQFELPDAIDQDKISAELKNGVLTLHLPKIEKSAKLIPIKVA